MDDKLQCDNRKFDRVTFRRAVKFRMDTGEVNSVRLASDIGQGGMRMNSSDFIPLGSLVRVYFQFEDEGRLLDLEGKVVWGRYLPRFDGYQFGLEFSGGSLPEKQNIAQYVHKVRGG